MAPRDRDAYYVAQQVRRAWDGVLANMRQMYQASAVGPSSGFDVFDVQRDGDGDVEVRINPVVFSLPEKANQPRRTLYAAVTGWLSFYAGDLRAGPLRTKSFGTKVGYFRAERQALRHVYGAHYDLDEVRPGHPIMHMQMGSQKGLGADVAQQFRTATDVVDCVDPLLTNVRTPSAQMDVFAVVTQLCADHLIYAESGPDVHRAFAALRSGCDFFVGVGHRLTRLNCSAAATCYRSTHWYP